MCGCKRKCLSLQICSDHHSVYACISIYKHGPSTTARKCIFTNEMKNKIGLWYLFYNKLRKDEMKEHRNVSKKDDWKREEEEKSMKMDSTV